MRTYRLKPGSMEWREVDGEVVALDLAASRYLGINQTGAVLWPLLTAGSQVDTMAEALNARFGVDVPTATKHVEAFIAELSSRGLIEES